MIDTSSRTPSGSGQPRHTVEGDHGLFAQCPDCSGHDFLIEGSDVVLFACLSCNSRWRYALGYVWQVVQGQQRSRGTHASEGLVTP